MNRAVNFLACFMATILLSCCQKSIDSKNQISNSNTLTQNSNMKTDIGISKINTKKEIRNDGNFNQMTLFKIDDTVNLEELKNFCSQVKPDYQDGYFQILVFFKKADLAGFPENPVTGMYSEDEDLRNIKATYTINNINGYSKLDYYEKNSLESRTQSIEIN